MAYRKTARTEQRKEERRERLILSARSLISESGFAGTRAKDIAQKSGVSEGTVFRYFPTLAQLFVEVYRSVASQEIEVVREVAQGEGAASERVAAVIQVHLDRALRRPGLAHALVAEPLSAELEAVRLVHRRYFQDVLADIMSDGVTAGEYRHFDVETAAACITGSIVEALVLPVARSEVGAPDLNARIDFVVHFCLNAIAPWRTNAPLHETPIKTHADA